MLDIEYNTGTSIKYNTSMGTWAKMEYPCNLAYDKIWLMVS